MDTEQRKLLQKFLDGNCTNPEQQLVKALLDTSEGKAAMQELMEERDIEAGLYALPGTDEQYLDERIKYLKKQLQQRIATVKKNESPAFRAQRSLRYAAVLAGIVIVSSIIIWQYRQPVFTNRPVTYIKKENPRGIPVLYKLPDSSKVYLAAGSSIRYPQGFTGKTRDVHLSGEAFFDVTHNDAKPFIVHAGGLDTKDMGTSFKIEANARQPVTVSVATGKVSVSKHNPNGDKPLGELTPGATITWDSISGQITRGVADINGMEQWKTGDLIFDGQPLRLVARELERRFGVKVIFDVTETENYKISGSFSANESAEEILRILSRLGKFGYKPRGNAAFYVFKNK